MRILLLDIESAPITVFSWGLFNQNIGIDQIAKSGYILCWAAKWLGEKPVFYSGLDTDSKKNMLKKMHKLLSEADAVITYNGNRYDLPTLNRDFLKNGMKPPAPYKKIDLLNTARRQFRFESNKLDYVARSLGVGTKIKHKGMQLWLDCMNKDKDAWKTMQSYNKQDVVLLEKVYEKMRPWVANHPSFGVFQNAVVCPVCGSAHFQKRGTYHTSMGEYQRYVCNKCGHWFHDNKNLIRGTMKGKSVPL